MRILTDEVIGTVDPRLHSGFVEHMGRCVNGGVWDGERVRPAVADALREIAHPVIRWPGGCFADDYRWRDGIGPRETRPVRVSNHWGEDEIDPNTFGTHEFMAMCRDIGSEPWFGLSLGVDGPREAHDWLEYCNFRGDTTLTRERAANGSPGAFEIRYWGIGNESWDGGGKMNPADYARAYRRTESHLPSSLNGAAVEFIAVGPDGNKAAESEAWTRGVLVEWLAWRRPRVSWWDAHFYLWAIDGGCGTITHFDREQWDRLFIRMDEMEKLVVSQRALLDEYAEPGRPKIELCVGEWGIWHDTGHGPTDIRYHGLRDALVCAVALDILHRQADKVRMAAIAQSVNILAAPINVSEDGVVVRSPIWDVFVLYKAHRGGVAVRMETSFEDVTGSATLHDGRPVVSLVNRSYHEERVIELPFLPTRTRLLSNDDLRARNTPDDPDRVRARKILVSEHLVLPPGSMALLEG